MLVADEHLPLPDLLGRDLRDSRQARLPAVRRDPRDLLRGGPDGVRPRPDGRPGFEQLGWIVDLQESAAGLLRAERPAPPALSLRVRLDRGGET